MICYVYGYLFICMITYNYFACHHLQDLESYNHVEIIFRSPHLEFICFLLRIFIKYQAIR